VEHQCVVMEDEKAGGRAGVRDGVAGEHSSARPVTDSSIARCKRFSVSKFLR
jgi:hypothetical protein